MSENDSSSEDDDYKPSKAEITEADVEVQRQKRRKLSDAEEAVLLAKVCCWMQGCLKPLGKLKGKGGVKDENDAAQAFAQIYLSSPGASLRRFTGPRRP